MIEVNVKQRSNLAGAITIKGLNFTEEDLKDAKFDCDNLPFLKDAGLVITFNPFTSEIYILLEADVDRKEYLKHYK